MPFPNGPEKTRILLNDVGHLTKLHYLKQLYDTVLALFLSERANLRFYVRSTVASAFIYSVAPHAPLDILLKIFYRLHLKNSHR